MASTPNDKLMRLQTYADKLQQRLNGQLDKELRNVIEIDLRKTKNQIAKLKG